jgi:hypothetical protein
MQPQCEYVNKNMSFKNNFVYNFHESTLFQKKKKLSWVNIKIFEIFNYIKII